MGSSELKLIIILAAVLLIDILLGLFLPDAIHPDFLQYGPNPLE